MSLMFGDDMFCKYAVSRAVDEDYDDEEEERIAEKALRPFVLTLSPGVDSNRPSRCTSLIIAIGPVASGFIKAHLLDSHAHEVIGRMCQSDTVSVDCESDTMSVDCDSDDQTSPDKSCLVYRLNEPLSHVSIVQCQATVTAEQSFSFTQQLMSSLCLKSVHVIILSTLNRNEYKCALPASDVPDNFLRMLHSQTYLGSRVCEPVEQPNTVDGLPAQLLTYCQINRVPCALFVCYTNLLHVDLDSLKAFNKVLRVEPLNQLSKESVDVERRLSKVVQQLHSANRSLSLMYL